MKNKPFGQFIVTCFVLLALPPRPAEPGSDPPQDPPSRQLSVDLHKAGWPEQAAQRVVEVHAPWLAVLSKENPAQAAKQLALLKGLGKYPIVMPLLEKHPEAAGLLAGVGDPVMAARTLSSAGKDYDLVVSLYAVHAAPEDASLDSHGSFGT